MPYPTSFNRFLKLIKGGFIPITVSGDCVVGPQNVSVRCPYCKKATHIDSAIPQKLDRCKWCREVIDFNGGFDEQI